MLTVKNKLERRTQRVRAKFKRIASGRLRLSVFRSNSHIYAQVIDDVTHVTLVAASTVDKDLRASVKSGSNKAAAEKVGQLVAERAKKAGIQDVFFDRGGYLYHGRVKALADAARAAGLNF